MITENTEASDAASALWKVAVQYDCLRETMSPLEGVRALTVAAANLLDDIHQMTDADEAWSARATLHLDQCQRMVRDAFALTLFCPSIPAEDIETSGSNRRRAAAGDGKARSNSRRGRAT